MVCLWKEILGDKNDVDDDEDKKEKRENADSTRVWFFYVIVAIKTKCEVMLCFI